MEWHSVQAPYAVEMMQKSRPLSFLGRRSTAPRPLSEATEIFDTDSEDELEQDRSTPRSFQSMDNDSQTTLSSQDDLRTPSVLGGFEFHFEEKPIQGPVGPHLFRASPDIASPRRSFEDLEFYPGMSPAEEPAIRVEMTKPALLARPETPKARPFSSLNTAVAELDESQVRDWTPRQVAEWMLAASFERSVVDKFLTHDISGVVLLDLQFEDLKELDITSYGHRHRVMSSIQHLRNSATISLESSLSRSNSRADRHPRALQRAPQPEETKVLAYQTQQGLKSRSSSAQRRGRLQHVQQLDNPITPAESISIVAIEQLLPKPHKCSKGEDCSKWQKQQRKLQKLQEEFVNAQYPTTAIPTTESESRSPIRPKSDAVPSVVASSDVLGPGELPPFYLTPGRLSELHARDPQESVRQFLSFQHMHSSSSNDPSPPPASSASFVPQALTEHLRSLPKLTIPLEAPAPPLHAGARTPISALRQPTQLTSHLMAQLQNDPYHYGGVASPADIYRVGTPFSVTDMPVTSFAIDPLSRDVSQSVPPEMRYGSHVARVSHPTVEPIQRPSSTQPSPAATHSRRHPRAPSFTPSIPPVTESANTATVTAIPASSRTPRAELPLHPSQRPSQAGYAGWMRKRQTKMLRHEWHDQYVSLKGTQLAVSNTEKTKPVESIDVDEYTIACSSTASNSKLSAAFKKSILGGSHRATSANEQAFAFSLIPDNDKSKKMFNMSKSHHFSVKSRDERIDWMRELMLAKALKLAHAAEGAEVMMDGNMI